METQKIVLARLCLEQFNQKGVQQILFDKDEFLARVNQIYKKEDLKDGYAPFCKHLFIENFTETPNYIVKITEENESLIRSSYKARNERELPVLSRFIPLEKANLQKAKYLDMILYTKEQITNSCKARNVEDLNGHIDYEYGIIFIKPQDVDFETPMWPITMMRNELGQAHGGSGEKIVKEDYMKAVQFWTEHVTIE